MMDCYRVVKEVGDGTFGCVWRAVNKFTGEIVAIKKMKKKYYSWEECMNLREVKSLRIMEHPNIVKLKEVIREHDILYLVFEFMDLDLYQLMKGQTQLFSESRIRSWCFQVFHALAYIHQRGCFHRDLKPENLLVSKDVIKVADFGLARDVCSEPPFTEYVSTRWYRAPEVLLQSPVYGTEVDMWAMGAIMAELFTLRPLFPGSSEADEIFKICSVIGSPNLKSWPEGLCLASKIKFQFPQFSGVPLSDLIPSASHDAVNLIRMLCSWNPQRRPSAAEALKHPFFQSCIYIPPALRRRATGPTTQIMTASPYAPPCGGTDEESLVQKRSTAPWRNNSVFTLPPPLMKPGVGFSLPVTVTVSSPKTVFASADCQRKLEMDHQAMKKNGKTCAQAFQPRYQPPLRSNCNTGAGVYQQHAKQAPGRGFDPATKMGQMTLGPVTRPPQATWRQQVPPPMKAGGWHSQPNHQIPVSGTVRTVHRKVAG